MKEDTASSTAYTVLQGLVYVARRTPHSYLVPDNVTRLGECVLSASEEGRARLAELDKPFVGLKTSIREFIFLPGITLHYILRKRCIEDNARAAIAKGITQVVSLGAGYDSLVFRLSCEFPDVNFIEIDHPATQKFKADAFENTPESEANLAKVHYLSVDFTHQNIEDRLRGFEQFDPSRPTLFISEGVTVYLTEEEVTHMFTAIRNLTGVGTQFLFTVVEPHGSPRSNTRKALSWYLNFIGEPLKWTMEAPHMEAFLKTQGCKLHSIDATEQFREKYMSPERPARLHHGEYVVLAEFA